MSLTELTIPQLFQLADQLKANRKNEEVVALYRAWLAVNSVTTAYAVWFNLGVELGHLKRHEEAIEAYRAAIFCYPDFLPARFNIGAQLEQLGRTNEALATWRAILTLPPELLDTDPALHQLTLNNLGRLLEIEREYPASEAILAESLQRDSNQPHVLQHWLHLRQKQCAWPICIPLADLTPLQMWQAASTLSTLALTDDPEWQLEGTQRFIANKVTLIDMPLTNVRDYAHPRLRLGYLSSDFCLHPVALLMAELFELHDRDRFELYGFCWSREDGSAMRRRIIHAMDHFIRIGDMDDARAAQCIRDQEIDILIDLHGLTSGARPNVLAYRPAPVQITYLGLPGTSGHPELDYVIADNYLIPPEEINYYSERPLYMPHCFQVCDRQREVAPPQQRAECQLPTDAFVFCCFNNNYKITPELFAVWMRILHHVPHAVLWLLADNPQAQVNMKTAAEQAGITPERLIFTTRVAPPVYLARYALADVFLDTFPFNGGTTANDALWMGLPLLTLSGRSFASRMAGSLLTTLGLAELITTSLDEYEERAVYLANTPDYCATLRQHLQTRRDHSRPFDMPQQARDLETLYLSAYSERLMQRAAQAQTIKRLLHVGCGKQNRTATLPLFMSNEWLEIRCDIDPDVKPDVLASMTDLRVLNNQSVDAVFSRHNLEHLYAHEVSIALKEFWRVLTPTGFVIIICPDLQSVCAQVAAGQLTTPLYHAPVGVITALDILYGLGSSIAAGNQFMAHRTGFTRDTLITALKTAGFGRVAVVARAAEFDLWAIATKAPLNDANWTHLCEKLLATQ
ncbi:methyltransferase domain-containing protein [Rhodoferax sp. 4810]|uniref:protein O-GlcNAc transferase n=1 Tax=Thiospirillum jenense TaxID=1653858 RepID=A0A839H8F0_9GAMM|nr:methyltransferase domain-containing protein [Thiospirillum jenense]MBB1073353.1 methyltransferase domain-containing protein [Rhodoferax jenense]MBB1125705.1 methyltransferase domain-containing protein [Thiospirillum jenense]